LKVKGQGHTLVQVCCGEDINVDDGASKFIFQFPKIEGIGLDQKRRVFSCSVQLARCRHRGRSLPFQGSPCWDIVLRVATYQQTLLEIIVNDIDAVE